MPAMKTALVLLATSSLLFFAGSASAAVTNYVVDLDGTQESPAVTTDASGSGTLAYDDGTKKLTGSVTFKNLADVSAAHIHQAACGVNGGPIVTLTANTSSMTIDETLDDAQATALVAGDLYINIHTSANPGGEIRGQILADGGNQKCGGAGGEEDAGSSSGSSGNDDGSSSSSSSSSSGATDGSSSGSNGATTTRPDDGSGSAATASQDDGCSTTGGAPGNGLAIALGVGVALAAIARGRKKR